MADPRPVRLVGMVTLVGLGWLGYAWSTMAPLERAARLAVIALSEHATAAPPVGLLAQADWLLRHRVAWLSGVVALVALAGLLGVAQGLERRRQDALGGFRLSAWTLGLVGGALLPGLVGAVVLAPVVLGQGWVGVGFAVLVGLVGYLVCWGRPSVP